MEKTVYVIDDLSRSIQRDMAVFGWKLLSIRPVAYRRGMKVIMDQLPKDLRLQTIYEIVFSIEEEPYSKNKEAFDSYLSLMEEPFRRLPRYSMFRTFLMLCIIFFVFFSLSTLSLAFAYGGPLNNPTWAIWVAIMTFGLMQDLYVPTVIAFVMLGIGIMAMLAGIIVFSLLWKRKKKAYDEAVSYNEALEEKKRQAFIGKAFFSESK